MNEMTEIKTEIKYDPISDVYTAVDSNGVEHRYEFVGSFLEKEKIELICSSVSRAAVSKTVGR